MALEEDDYGDYSSAEEETTDLSDGDGDYENKFADDDTLTTQKEYTVLRESDIRKRQEADITHVSTVLSLSISETSLLLRHHSWNVTRLLDEWFSDEEKVRTSVGLLNFKILAGEKISSVCGICFDSYAPDSMLSVGCGHEFCVNCWKGYVTTAISDGSGCLMLRCPEPSCNSAIGDDMIEKVASDEDKERYYRFLFRSYIGDKKKIKWCPAPGCEYAVEFHDLWTRFKDVTCFCSNTFCWNCLEEVHRPVDCTTVANWVLKNSSEAENPTWMLVYTKPCPKCKCPIEKNQGCNHMTCGAPCKFEFCWVCLGPWKNHAQASSCNAYSIKKPENERSEREKAKVYLEKYNHYFGRWSGNQRSRVQALEQLRKVQDVNLEKLGRKYGLSSTQLEFIVDAWMQIVECRRVLKWTYAYGYYLPEDEDGKKDLFEFLQGEAEVGLERLHECAEKNLSFFLKGDGNGGADFMAFRFKLCGLTTVTKNYFDNLVRALENGLSDVSPMAGCSSSRPKRKKVRSKEVKRKRTKRLPLVTNFRGPRRDGLG